MYKALYREFRPETFEEVLGQEHIVKILKNQLATHSVSHAYLFCGTRGTGKTTMARLLAKGVNCLSPHEDGGPCGECENCRSIQEGKFLDVIEIDAASNNGVDNIRELRESVKYPPAVGGKKVYIIDEVHMLSAGAFNALLKTLEEPPEHVMFVLATTEPQKLLATILSRCMRLDFKRVTEKVLVRGMGEICSRKGIDVDEDALRLIATNADGSVRDGLSILDQCLATGDKHITRAEVASYLGTTGEEAFIELTEIVRQGKVSDALLLVDKILDDGKDVRQFMKDWLGHYRNLMITKFLKSPEDVLGMSLENIERLRAQSDVLDMQEINNAIIELSHTLSDARWSTQPRILLELCTVKLATGGAFGKAAPAPAVAPATASVLAASEPKPAPAPAPAAATAPAAAPIPASASGDYDLDEIWLRVFEEGESTRASFNLLRTKSSLEKISEDKFYVAVENKFSGKYVFENRDTLEELMQRFTGRPLKLECMVRTAAEAKNETSPEQMKADLEAMTGIDIELK
ncbi:MAG: DNA polymerase III subunit gamma/tau [Firmicutes bacterium]|nr:DNA polymerase III subunit gamma/tau [Bacillota bacterium]